MRISLDTAARHHHTLAEARRAAGDPEAALPHYARAIDLCPADADAHNDLGRALEMLGRPADARAMYRRALAIEPGHVSAHVNLGLVSLLLGDYGTGWRECEWRWREPAFAAAHPCPGLPRFDGTSDPAGRTLLVCCEQGPGDCIQFARYLPLLSGRGADVVLRCPRPLARLFGGLPGVRVVADGNPPPPPPRADAWVPIASLPLMFETTPATVPTFAAYLRADAQTAKAWRERVRPLRSGGRRLAGLVWAGDPAQPEDRSRSLDLRDLAPLAGASGVRFVSLQQGPAASQLSEAPAGVDILDLSPHLHDFAETAAAVAQLDLVIAADTSVAHLAGALGKPVWTLVRFAADWRWSVAGDDTPWYPTMRLFRQATRGDWGPVVHEIVQATKREFAPPRTKAAA